MQVIATDKGFDGHKVREVGESFEMPEGSKAKWFYAPSEASAEERAIMPTASKPRGRPKTHSEASADFEDAIPNT